MNEEMINLKTKVDGIATDVAVIKSNISLTAKTFVIMVPFVFGFMAWLTLRVIDMPTKSDIKVVDATVENEIQKTLCSVDCILNKTGTLHIAMVDLK